MQSIKIKAEVSQDHTMTALIEHAVLLTNDKKLHEIAGLQCRSLVLKM